MTRKDYILIAAALKDAHALCSHPFAGPVTAEAGCELAAQRVADALARDNPRFDRERFLKAAGVQS